MRTPTLSLAALVTAAFVVLGSAVPASATVGPESYQVLATDQTRQLMRYLVTPFAQLSSPATCDRAATSHGTLLLPVLAGLPGTRTFHCTSGSGAVLVDLGGFVVGEDTDPNDTYTTADGTVLRFSRGSLAAIAEDAIRFVAPGTLTVDGRRVRNHEAVATSEFVSVVQQSTGSRYDDSVTLGHPGRLWTAYAGYKQVLRLGPGQHTIVADVSAFVGSTAVLTFVVDV